MVREADLPARRYRGKKSVNNPGNLNSTIIQDTEVSGIYDPQESGEPYGMVHVCMYLYMHSIVLIVCAVVIDRLLLDVA